MPRRGNLHKLTFDVGVADADQILQLVVRRDDLVGIHVGRHQHAAAAIDVAGRAVQQAQKQQQQRRQLERR